MTEFDDLGKQHRFGWVPDYPDVRDFKPETQEVAKLFAKSKATAALATLRERDFAPVSLPARVDLRSGFPRVHDQGDLGSCTAHAADSIMEYCEKRAFGTYIDVSRLFVYKVTRDLLGWQGDTGAYIRTTMGVLTLFGTPPEKYWPYDISKFDKEPAAFLYALAQSYKATVYYRLDVNGIPTDALLKQIKLLVASGFPSMFGFTVYTSISQASENDGKIPFPVPTDKAIGGHAIAVAGYDDHLKIKNQAPGATETMGALLIRNSWGSDWGEGGYGWLPYEYVLQGLAVDWWSLLKAGWIETGQFGC